MSEHDEDLRAIFRTVADGVEQRAGSERTLLTAARKRRLMTAGAATLFLLLLVGGIAGASRLARDGDEIEPAPRPERVTEEDLASMTVDEFAAALFSDDELEDATPSGFTVDQIVRNGPEETSDDYATVGIQMSGPVDYARTIFFVHPDEPAAQTMYEKELYKARFSFEAARQSDGFRGWRPYALPDALPGTKCSAGNDNLFTCTALHGRVLMLTQSSAGGASLGPKVSEIQLKAAESLARTFGSYLSRIYREPEADAVRNVTFARYFFDGAKENMRASGVVEVNSEEGTLCFEGNFSGNILASHLLWTPEGLDDGTPTQEITAVTFFDPEDDEVGAALPTGSPICLQEEQLGVLNGEFEGEDLQTLVDHPEQFRIDFHRGPNDEPGLVAQLNESPGPNRERANYYADEQRGFGVHVPKGWKIARTSLTPNLDDPREILSLGTAPMSPGGSCAQQPVRALEALRPTDAFISIQERRGEAGHSGRPDSFRDELEDRFFNIDLCTDLRNLKPYWFAFSDAGRDFHLLAALGTDASIERTRQFWAVLDSLEFFESDETVAVRSTVARFMQARVDGVGATAFLGTEGWPDTGPAGEPAPLYPDPPLDDFRIEFVDDNIGQGSFEVGVTLIFEGGAGEETLFVRRSDGGFVIVGARGGLEGP